MASDWCAMTAVMLVSPIRSKRAAACVNSSKAVGTASLIRAVTPTARWASARTRGSPRRWASARSSSARVPDALRSPWADMMWQSAFSAAARVAVGSALAASARSSQYRPSWSSPEAYQ